jgi:staphylococcal nuclease domain-containing protein 1
MNVQLVSEGLARVPTATAVEKLASRMSNTNAIMSLAAALNVAQETARKSRAGMWRYGDIGEDDPDEN